MLAAPAGFSFPSVNTETRLKLPLTILPVAVIGERRPTPINRLAQESGGNCGNLVDSLPAQLIGPHRGPDARIKEQFIAVNVPQPGNDLLIQQQIADLPLRLARPLI